ncbi:MAG: transcriptional regulator [Micrococcales bacterium]|nr:transcriptional regulator [Micrococcales bacterium]
MGQSTGWFALILIVALLLSVGTSILQHLYYSRAAQRMTRAFAGENDMFLVSGRGKGYLRGAVVLLVIDRKERRIVAAEGMVGITVFARFRGRPEIIGPIKGVFDRISERKLRDAVQYALDNYTSILRARASRAAQG